MSKVTLVLVGTLVLAAIAIAATPARTNSVSAEIETTVRGEIQAAVRGYVDAQNRGNVHDMMAMVSRRDGVISISDGQIQRGWQTIRNSNVQIVGRDAGPNLSVGAIDVVVLSPMAAVAIAPFTFLVASPQGELRVPGATTLVFQKSGNRWFVVHEHTSISTQEVARGID